MSILAGKAHIGPLTGLADGLGRTCSTLSALLGAERPERKQLATELGELLEEADAAARVLLGDVARSFITPIDRVMLADLATGIPDVIERLYGTGELILEHRIGKVPEDAGRALASIERSAEIIGESVRSFGRPRDLIPLQHEIRRLMRDARSTIRRGLAETVSATPDPRLAQRERDILQQLIRVTEGVDTVAGTLRGVAVRES
ncbi:MAG: hypothetical protein Q4G64_03510 [bacterium]|nr:hypothetical protein [bacterium]